MKQFFHSLFYLPKHEKLTDKSFMKIVISSITGIVLCCLCLVSLTWAWFSDSAAATGSTLKSAGYWAEVKIEKVEGRSQQDPIIDQNGEGAEETDADSGENGEGLPEDIQNDEGTVTLRVGSPFLLMAMPTEIEPQQNVTNSYPIQILLTSEFDFKYRFKNFESGTYMITVKAKGTATQTGGFITVKIGEEVLYTEQILPEKTFVFTLDLDAADVSFVDLICFWGPLPTAVGDEDIIKNEFVSEVSKNGQKDSSGVVSEVSSVSGESSESSEIADSSDESSDVSSESSEVTSSEDSSVDDVSDDVTSSNVEVSDINSEEVSSSESSAAE